MLRIHTVTSATDAKRYYAAADYYAAGQETVGRWGGKLASVLGLAGTVTKAAFDRLCDNLHPLTGEKMTPRTNAERRVGYDLTFSGPKSFSVLEGLADDAERLRLMAAFDAAIVETLEGDIEPDMQTRVRKDGAKESRTTGNMLWAGFDHSTSRPVAGSVPDPHRHRHVLGFNATWDAEESRIKAGEFGNVVRDKAYYQAAFFARLANRLGGLGYGIDRRADGRWEIAGVPQSVIDTFSKRTDEIEDEAERRGIVDERRKAELGAKTRSKKQKELSPAELRKAWDAQLTDAEREALGRVYRKEIEGGREVSAREAVAFAVAHCFEQQSVVPERELKRVTLLHGLGSLTPGQVAAELPRHGVIVDAIDGRMMATTKELLREEDAIAGFALGGRGAVLPLGVAGGLERGKLNDGQWQAVTGLLESPNRVNLVEGPAGAGKSSLLERYDQGVKFAGGGVTYLATTATAVKVLEKDGFAASTVARFLLDERMQKAAAKGGRVVVDEASMLGHKDAYRLIALAGKLDLKMVFVGDAMQHGSVPRGAFLHVLKEFGGVQPFRLTQILRQKDDRYRAAAMLLSEGKTLEGFDAIDGMGWVQETEGDAERYRRIGAEYLDAVGSKKSVLVVSPTHAEAAAITAEIRSQLKAAGKLDEAERAFTRLVAVNVSEAERGQASTYRPGDVLVFHQNAKGFTKSDRLTVADAASLPLTEAGKFSLYRPEAIELSEGDVIRFTGTVKTVDDKHKLTNGTARTVAGFDKRGNIRLDNGWTVGKDAGHFRHGFVETSFGSQGRTVDRVILGMSSASLPATNQEQMYVSASRARERMTLHTDDKAAVRDAVQRSSKKLAALDLGRRLDQRAEMEREQRERRRRFGFLARLRSMWDRPTRPMTPPPRPRPAASHADRERARQENREHGHAR